MNRRKFLELIGLTSLSVCSARGHYFTFTSEPFETRIQFLSGRSREDAVLWEFKAESGRNSGLWKSIAVPSCWEQEGFGIYRYGLDKNPPNVRATYRRKFEIEPFGRGHVRLWFDGVMTDADVKVNGYSAGPVHAGGFSPFSFDVTSLLKAGENEIEVFVSENSAIPGINDSERHADFWMFGGIHRPVFLEFLPEEFIDRIAADARADGTLKLEVFPSAIKEADRITARLQDRNGIQIGRALETTIEPKTSRISLAGQFENPKLWSPETPHLYQLTVTLYAGDKPLHCVKERIGFRTFEIVTGGGFALNGRRIVLKGVDRPAFRAQTARTLSARNSREDVLLVKAMNCNAILAGHYPADRHFLDACDELGLLVVEELLAWIRPLPTAEGARLIREMVHRDQNHPCIVFWANGNHKAFNPRLETVFLETDLQQRRPLRMEPRYGELPRPATPGLTPVDTRFYPTYNELTSRLDDPYPVCPFETLHALYDGGGGASLKDYFSRIEASPVGGGLFIWELVDEAIARTDKNGELDPKGNESCDGIVGPHHELEASYFTVRDIFSPVQLKEEVTIETLRETGQVVLQNKFHNTDLNQCRFERELFKCHLSTDNAEIKPPINRSPLSAVSTKPGSSSFLSLELPDSLDDFDYLKLAVYGPDEKLIREWSWPIQKREVYVPAITGAFELSVASTKELIQVNARDFQFVFHAVTARLIEARHNNVILPLRNGPDIAWALPARSVIPKQLQDGVAKAGDAQARAKTSRRKKTANDSNNGFFRTPATSSDGPAAQIIKHSDRVEITQINFRGFNRLVWNIFADGTLKLDYDYKLSGTFDSFGISFDSDESKIKSVKWLGNGPHPVWKNRLDGGTFGFWSKDYADTEPGHLWKYPYFKGCHRDTVWFRFETAHRPMTVWIPSDDVTPRWFTPNFGAANPLNAKAALPPGDLSFLHAIPPIGEKWHPPEDLGPSAKPAVVNGDFRGTLFFRFI